jgi:hypothetical protein
MLRPVGLGFDFAPEIAHVDAEALDVIGVLFVPDLIGETFTTRPAWRTRVVSILNSVRVRCTSLPRACTRFVAKSTCKSPE